MGHGGHLQENDGNQDIVGTTLSKKMKVSSSYRIVLKIKLPHRSEDHFSFHRHFIDLTHLSQNGARYFSSAIPCVKNIPRGEYYLFVPQLKAVFLNLFFNGRALSNTFR